MTIDEKKMLVLKQVSQLVNMLSQIDYHLYEDDKNADKYLAKSGLNNNSLKKLSED